MADNFTVLDSAAGTITIRATDLAGVHIPWHRSTGPTAHDAAVAENPVLAAGYASAAAPAAVSADGDVVRLWALRNGALATVLTAAGALIGGDAGNGLDVDVTRLPALVAGTANIGDVDVLTLPSIPAGANLIGSVTAVGGAAHDAAISANPVPIAGVASAAAPSAVSADQDVVRLWALRNGALAVNLTAAGALIPGDAGNGLDVDVTRMAALVAGAALIGRVSVEPQTANGLSISRLVSAASTNATTAKASAGQLYGWYLYNANAAVRFLKIYDKASNPTVGTDTPVLTIPIPPGSAANVEFTNGIAFPTGIAFALTTGGVDSDNTGVAATEIFVNLLFK